MVDLYAELKEECQNCGYSEDGQIYYFCRHPEIWNPSMYSSGRTPQGGLPVSADFVCPMWEDKTSVDPAIIENNKYVELTEGEKKELEKLIGKHTVNDLNELNKILEDTYKEFNEKKRTNV